MSLLSNGVSAPAGNSLADLVDQLTARLQAGEEIDSAAIVAAHPEHANRLSGLLPALRAVAALGGSGDLTVGGPPLNAELGDFRIVREVGRGGMGVVYEAEQLSLRRRVALKVLPFAATMDPKQLQRFRNEALAAASLHHEHIVPVHAVGCERGVHYYAMQFIDGHTLADMITARPGKKEPNPPAPFPKREGGEETGPEISPPFPLREAGYPAELGRPRGLGSSPTAPVAALSTKPDRAVGRAAFRQSTEWIAQAAEALEYAHSMGIVHRDVKPGNLMVDAAGKLWVADFGLARFGADAGLTMTGDLVGTLRYMAPEQAMARHGLADHRVDVYGLGCTLYELFTGKPAVDGSDKADIVRRIAFEEPVAPRKLDKHVPAELETITLKCLAKNPNERYTSAGELAADLRRFLDDQPIKAKPPTIWQRSARRLWRHPRVVAAAFAVVLLAAVGATVSTVLIERQKQRAEDAYGGARAAYARARLALDRMSSQVIDEWLAKQPVLTPEQKQFLEGALGDYEWLAGRAGADVETRMGMAAAHLRVGDIRARLGQIAEAEVAYARAVELYQQLADEFPDTPAYRQALAAAHRAHGSAFHRIDRTRDAESSYQSALALQDRLISDAPTGPEYGYELAGTLLEYGDLLYHIGRLGDAERSFQRGLDQVSGPAAAATSSTYRHRQAQLHIHLGSVLRGGSRTTEAAQSQRRGVELLDELVKSARDGPAAARYRDDLAAGLTSLSETLGDLGRADEAEKADRRAIEIRERQTAEFPAVPEYRRALASTLYELGNHLYDLGRAKEAAPHYERAIVLLEGLVRDYPAEANYRLALGWTYDMLGVHIYTPWQRFPEAEQVHRKALAVFEKLMAEFPAVPVYRSGASTSNSNLGNVLSSQGRFEEALAAFRRCLELGSQRPGWHEPSAKRVREVQLAADLERRLPAVLAGDAKPADAAEQVGFAKICYVKKQYAAAARLFTAALAADPTLTTVTPAANTDVAAYAPILAAAGQGPDADKLDESERSKMRQQALDWLTARLAHKAQLAEPPASRPSVSQDLSRWRDGSELAGVRGNAIAKLPEAERAGWQKFWADVDALQKRCEKPLAPPTPPPKP